MGPTKLYLAEDLEETIPGEIRTHAEVWLRLGVRVRSGSCQAGVLIHVSLGSVGK